MTPLACGGRSDDGAASHAAVGKAIFERACAGCHTLGADKHSALGGDLATNKLPIADLISFARIMPARLTTTQLTAVADYIHNVSERTNPTR